MAMMRYVQATVKRVLDTENATRIVVCKDSNTVKEEPDEDDESKERECPKGHKASQRAD
jgi:hypothetical protein